MGALFFDQAPGEIHAIPAPNLVFADELPTRNFVDDEQPDTVAFIQERFVIRVMRGADDVEDSPYFSSLASSRWSLSGAAAPK